MNIIDLHTHTISSGHAYSTLEENVKGARASGLKVLGMSDHASTMPGAPHEFHFLNLKVIPDYIDGVRVLKGIEANIMDYIGTIDVDEHLISKLDYVIASLHPPILKPGTIEENTNTILKVMDNPLVNIIGHPDDGRYPLDYEKIVLKAKETKTLLEVNNSSLKPTGSRVNTIENTMKLLELCKEHQVPIILGSDAHISFSVGQFHACESMLQDISFPKSLIVNNDLNQLNDYIKI